MAKPFIPSWSKPKTPVAPTEARGPVPSSVPLASVRGPTDDVEDNNDIAKPGVQSFDDYKTTVLKAQEGILGFGAGPTGEFAGARAYGVAGKRRDMIRKAEKVRRGDFQARWQRDYDEEERKQMESEVRVEVSNLLHKEMLERRSQEGDALFMDTDPYGRARAMAEATEGNFITRALSPIWASGVGVDVAFHTGGEDDMPETITYNESDAWGSVDWLTRISGLTWYSTAASVAGVEDLNPLSVVTSIPDIIKAWGTEEHLAAIMEGRDLISEADSLNLGPVSEGSALDQFLSKATQAVIGTDASTVSDYTVAFGLSLFDPDVFLALGPISKGVKVGGKALGLGAEAFKARKITQGSEGMDLLVEAYKSGVAEGGVDAGLEAVETAGRAHFGSEWPVHRLAIDSKYAATVGKGNPTSQHAFAASKARIKYLENYERMYGDAAHVAGHADEAAERGASALVPDELDPLDVRIADLEAEGVRVHSEIAELRAATSAAETGTPMPKGWDEGESMHGTTRASTKEASAGDEATAALRAEKLAALEEEAKGIQRRINGAKGSKTRPAGAASGRPLSAKARKGADGRSDLEIARDLTAAQMKHMSIAAVKADIENNLAAINKLSRATTHGAKVSRRADLPESVIDASEKMLGESVDEMTRLRDAYANVSLEGEGTVEEVQKAFNAAVKTFQERALAHLRLTGGGVDEASMLQDQLKTITAVEVGAREEMAELLKTASTISRKDMRKLAAKSGKIHEAEIKRMYQNASKRANDIAEPAYRDSLEQLASQWGNLAEGSEDGAVRALSSLRSIQEGQHIYSDWWPGQKWSQMGNLLRAVLWPSRKVFQTDSPEVAQIMVDMLGRDRAMVTEAVTVIGEVAPGPASWAASKMYLTTTEAMPLPNGFSIYNRSGKTGIDGVQATPWDEALSIFVHMAEGEQTQKAAQALSRMFVSDTDAMARESAGLLQTALRKALKASNGNIDNFMGEMQTRTASTGRGTGLNRQVVPGAGPRVWETAEQAMLRMKDEGIEVTDAMLRAESKAWEILTRATVHASTLRHTSDRLITEVTRKTTQEGGIQWADAVVAMENAFTPSKMGQGHDDAMAVFEAMGMRADQIQRYRSLGDKTSAGVQALSDGDGWAGFVPNAFLEVLEKDMGRMIKTFDLYKAQSDSPAADTMNSAFRQFGHLYSTSLVTGLVFPKILHFANIMFGNFGQVWAEEGLYTAGKVQASALNPFSATGFMPASLDHLPGPVGRGYKKTRLAMAAKLNVPLGELLPGVMSVTTNPHLAYFYDPHKWPDSTIIRDGLTIGDLRKVAVDHGVMSSFINSTGLREAFMEGITADGSKWKKVMEAASVPKQTYADMADVVEQRQRVAMFLELVANKGLSPEDAAVRVKRALYDWNSPMTPFETNTLARILMFWTFQRKALEQSARIIASPFTGGEGALANMSGVGAKLAGGQASQAAHVKDMTKALNAFKEAQRSGHSEDDDMKRVYPWWSMRAGSKEWMYNERMDPDLAEKYKQATGKEVTHEAYTLPAFTPLEMTNVWLSMIETAVAHIAEDGISGVPTGGYAAIEDFLVHAGGRVTGPAVEAAMKAVTGRQEDQYFKTGQNEYAMTDKYIIGGLDSMGIIHATKDSKSGGAVRLTPMGSAAYATMTPLSYEAVQAFEPILEAYNLDQDALPALIRMLRQYSGVYKSYYHNPEKTVKGDKRSVKKRAGAYAREWDRQDAFWEDEDE